MKKKKKKRKQHNHKHQWRMAGTKFVGNDVLQVKKCIVPGCKEEKFV